MAQKADELKTNAIRVLDGARVSYQLQQCDLSAESVATKIGKAPEAVFKTLIIQGDTTGYLYTLLPVGFAAVCVIALRPLLLLPIESGGHPLATGKVNMAP